MIRSLLLLALSSIKRVHTVGVMRRHAWQTAQRAALVVALIASVLVADDGPWTQARAARGQQAHGKSPVGAGLQSLQPLPAAPIPPVPAFQAFSQQQEFTANDAAENKNFGITVALAAASGNLAIIGAIGANNGAGAAYVFVRSGATWSQQAELTAGDAAANDSFGAAVAISADGTTVLVGAPGGSTSPGKAYVFVHSGDAWQQQGELSVGTTDNFGASVALSGNGATALIGAWYTDALSSPGAAYVFTRSADSWIEAAALTATGETLGDHFARGVALSGDGATALVGAPGVQQGGPCINRACGAVYIFTGGGSNWTQQATIAAPSEAGLNFGAVLALSANGSTVLVGSPTTYPSPLGAAYIFTGSGNSWTQQAAIAASDATPADNFGTSVALSADGGVALVGALPTFGGSAADAVYVFTGAGGAWTQQQKVTAGDEMQGDAFGATVALSGDASTVLVGAFGKNDDAGAAYAFTAGGPATTSTATSTPTATGATATASATPTVTATATTTPTATSTPICTSTFQQELTACDLAPYDVFGGSVALSSDGSTALVGTGGEKGADYVFVRSGSTWTQQAELSDPAHDIGGAVALSSAGSTALVASGGNNGAGAAYVFVRSGSTWTRQAELTASDGARNDGFGYAVALSGDGSTALVGAYTKNNFAGVAYVFTRSGSRWAQQQELTAGDAAPNDEFGQSVALSGDGSTALMGAPGNQVTQHPPSGAAYVFNRSGSSWSQTQKLTGTGAVQGDTEDQFGSAVALSNSGGLALVGSSFAAVGGTPPPGKAYLFARVSGHWQQQQTFSGGDATPNDLFGDSVALAATGSSVVALVGATSTCEYAGAAYLFSGSGSGVRQQAELADPNPPAPLDAFGSVALSADGSIALVGASGKNTRTGVAYVYSTGSLSGGSSSCAATPTSTPTQTATSTATPTQTATATPTASTSMSIAVGSGWNLISLPLQPTSTMMASALLHALLQHDAASKLVALFSLSGTSWSPPVIEQAGQPLSTRHDFSLAVGSGYLLYSDVRNSYSEQGTLPSSGPTWQVHQGWTLVGLSAVSSASVLSNSVLEAVRTSGGGGRLSALFALAPQGSWRPFQIDQNGTFTGDAAFPLGLGVGYLLYSDHTATVSPGAAAGWASGERGTRRLDGGRAVSGLPPLPAVAATVTAR